MARPQLSESEVEAFREEAAAAALEMVAEEGVASLTLRRLASRLGCSYAKPYSYYRDKEHLVDAVRGQAFDRLAAWFRDYPGDHGEPHFGTAYLRFAFENPEAFRIMFELRQDTVSDATRAAQQRAWEACTAPIRERVERGDLEGDPELIAHVVWAALQGLASLALANQLYLGKSVEEIASGMQSILRGFLPGVASRPLPWTTREAV
ncbi:MAG: TetR-like C-terminal domain-containing protein [Myxococcota bacterium]|nr:TetR-like C-terminal domain-containing protein [Myxococcota bacterium]